MKTNVIDFYYTKKISVDKLNKLALILLSINNDYQFYPELQIMILEQLEFIFKCLKKSYQKNKLFKVKINKYLINILIKESKEPDIIAFLYCFLEIK